MQSSDLIGAVECCHSAEDNPESGALSVRAQTGDNSPSAALPLQEESGSLRARCQGNMLDLLYGQGDTWQTIASVPDGEGRMIYELYCGSDDETGHCEVNCERLVVTVGESGSRSAESYGP